MRILVVGAGATGGFYGGRLHQAGRDVTFLARGARAQALRSGGLRIVSPQGDATLPVRAVTARELTGPHDLVLLTVKAYSLEQAIEDFAPAVGAGTLILPILNGMRHLDVLSARFGADRVLGGVSQVATQLDEQGRVVQFNALQKLVYGRRRGQPAPDDARLAAVHAALDCGGFDARLAPGIEQEMWDKWVFLATLGAATCLLGGSIGDIASVAGGAEVTSGLLDECCAVARTSGFPPAPSFVEESRRALTLPGSSQVSSMYRDMAGGREVEVDQILGDLLHRAAALDMRLPLVEAACVRLRVYSRRRARIAS